MSYIPYTDAVGVQYIIYFSSYRKEWEVGNEKESCDWQKGPTPFWVRVGRMIKCKKQGYIHSKSSEVHMFYHQT